ncbi:MAG: phenylalanine--tRNA ligase subunit alpha, partial [Planctomycetota bacterium]|nr:phenylalanine--tRNA ligase subunit alpha [Planctomycetota bacterium]
MKDRIARILEEGLREFAAASDRKSLDAVRARYLGQKGQVRDILSAIGSVPPEERKEVGRLANELRARLEAAFEERKKALAATPASEMIFDPTEPPAEGDVHELGRMHPLNATVADLLRIFASLGFEAVDGPEVEDERHNFDDLNIPKDHPARDSWDSFYLGGNMLLRSQTSTVQIRVMEDLARTPPTRVVAPGRVYRPDRIDATHASTFHQIEGLWVDADVSMADLKGVIAAFCRGIFGPSVRTRFRPSFFPFTEPSAEADASCPRCEGRRGLPCGLCRGAGWIEVGGCGMVNPKVFEAVCEERRRRGETCLPGELPPFHPERVTGFAFGFGIEPVSYTHL